MTVPNRAHDPARKQGDYTTPTGRYTLTVHNSNAPETGHPDVDHAIKQASFTAHQEGRTNAVGAQIVHNESGVTSFMSVQPMNDTEAAAHKESMKMGDYRVNQA